MITYQIPHTHKRQIVRAGRKTYLADKATGSITDNPYRRHSNKFALWNEGYGKETHHAK